ncbi:hypothetical protein V2G26_012197 [Clonostachys chloroleuca]
MLFSADLARGRKRHHIPHLQMLRGCPKLALLPHEWSKVLWTVFSQTPAQQARDGVVRSRRECDDLNLVCDHLITKGSASKLSGELWQNGHKPNSSMFLPLFIRHITSVHSSDYLPRRPQIRE